MSCVPYNIVKEGFISNIPSQEITPVSLDEINLLYDGDPNIAAITISGSNPTIGFLTEFGESYDVCYVDYYTDESDINNIVIKFGTTSGTENNTFLFLYQPGLYRATVSGIARFISIRHNIDSPTSIHQLEIYAQQNETLGFGDSPTDREDFKFLSKATSGALSASPNRVRLFNSNNFNELAQVAIAPTNSVTDSYVFLGTTEEGPFYGIDEYGFRQPGSNPLMLLDDPMTASTINPQWEVVSKAQARIIQATPEGLTFDLAFEDLTAQTPTLKTTGIISKDFFTANSFTLEVDVRFTRIETLSAFGASERDFFFVLTNGYPIPDYGYFQNYQGNVRKGVSVAGVVFSQSSVSATLTKDSLKFGFRYIDGTNSDNPRLGLFSSVDSIWDAIEKEATITSAADAFTVFPVSQAEMERAIHEGESFADFTTSAKWHRFKLVYDHVKQEISGYVNNIKMGSRVMGIESFEDSCRLFIGTQGAGGITWQLRNFKVYNNSVSNQQNLSLTTFGHTVSATISGVESNVELMRDESSSTSYIGPAPLTTSKIRIDFTTPQNVKGYALKQRPANQSTSRFGQTYFPDVARTVISNFGDKNVVVHTLPGDGSLVYRNPTYSGIPVIASGINFVELQFTSYDRTTLGLGALAIERFNVFTDNFVPSEPLPEAASTAVPWVEGSWLNLKQYGNSGALAIEDKISPIVGYWPFPEILVRGINYDVSSAVPSTAITPSTSEYDFAEVLFSAVAGTGQGGIENWQSGIQDAGDPIYVWRYFDTSSNIIGIYFNADTFVPSTVPDTFKFQYLRDGGNPTVDSDWVNIPPVTIEHPYTITPGDRIYKEYKEYLITNNDGEFYTNHYGLPAITDSGFTGFTIASTESQISRITNAPIPADYLFTGIKASKAVSLAQDRSSGLQGYIELDVPVRTRGIKMVVIPPTIDSGRQIGAFNSGNDGIPRFEFGLVDLAPIRDHGAGCFTSPVFDTGTRQNTERVKAFVSNYGNTSSSLYVRSSDVAPEYSYTPEYESWRCVGRAGNRIVPFISSISVFNHNRAIEVDGVVYFVMDGGFLSYDPAIDSWTELDGYPASSPLPDVFEDDGIGSEDSPGMLPDDNVKENVTVLDGVIYVASYDTGTIRIPRIMRYDTNNPAFGWQALPTNRPDFTDDNAVMVGLNGRLYFFNEDGNASYFDISTNNWILLETIVPTFGTDRSNMTGVSQGGMIYLFGGAGPGATAITIFNPETEQFTSGSSLPLPAFFHQALSFDDEKVIYLLPLSDNATNVRHGIFKYYVETDTVELITSLFWVRETFQGLLGFGLGRFHFKQGDYIVRYDTNTQMLFRARTKRDPWQHGKLPDIKDSTWGNLQLLKDLGWFEVGGESEIMPQKRYIQVKVELYSLDQQQSPVLEGINIVTPQEVEVPASGVADVYVKIKVDSDPRFDIWYSGQHRTENSEFTSIFYTTSDDGVNWGFPTLASGTFNILNGHRSVVSPWIVKTNDQYQVWYTQRQRVASVFTEVINYVSVSDPSRLATPGGAVTVISTGTTPENTAAVTSPSVVKESETSYKIWYTGTSSSSVKRIFYAESSDGVSWTNHQRVINIGEDAVHGYDSSHVYKPSVIKDGSIYKIWYTATDSSGINRIIYRESLDGISWEEQILTLDVAQEGAVDLDGVASPFVFKDSGTYRLYYTGTTGTSRTIISATSVDGINWVDFVTVIPSRGIHPPFDTAGPNDIAVIVSRGEVPTREFIRGPALKVHNLGAAL